MKRLSILVLLFISLFTFQRALAADISYAYCSISSGVHLASMTSVSAGFGPEYDYVRLNATYSKKPIGSSWQIYGSDADLCGNFYGVFSCGLSEAEFPS